MKRLPLFEKKKEKKIAATRCKTIAEELTSYYSNETELGWMNGLAGISCFFFHYYHFSGNKDYEKLAYSALERIITEIENGYSQPAFAGGLSGIHWLFKYLGEKGFISLEESNSLEGLKPMFLAFAQNQFIQSEYDYLHGALGIYTALHGHKGSTLDINQTDPNSFIYIIKKELSRLAIKYQYNSIYWEAVDPKTRLIEINMGLAHGVPSILLILSKIYKITKDQGILKNLIIPGMVFLQINSKTKNEGSSLFPTVIVDNNDKRPSRMAWCYGDPGVGSAIMQIGENCEKTDWIKFGSSILLNSSSRRKQQDTFISDACLCHGSAGLALIYYNAALKSGSDVLYDTASYWANVTLNFGKSGKTTSGYLFKGHQSKFSPQYNLLEGISGVGLSILAMLEEEMPGWEQGLLLS